MLEAVDIQEKKKIRFKIENLFDFFENKKNFKIIDLNFAIIKELTKRGRGLDLHDRVILTVNEMYQGIILTKDSEIKKLIDKIGTNDIQKYNLKTHDNIYSARIIKIKTEEYQ
ncbi:hypothetical protein KKA09_01235 [Patescibacteria group bacterium]|nr:hypothetical protein [Patescibacteria group bacterium]